MHEKKIRRTRHPKQKPQLLLHSSNHNRSHAFVAVLKSIYAYFEALKPEENELKKSGLNARDVKAVILAYYSLNDLLFGRVLGEKDGQMESSAFEDVLLGLANDSSFKVNFGELSLKMDSFDVEAGNERAIGSHERFSKLLLKLL